MDRPYKLTVPLSGDEEEQLRRLAERRGLSMADWVRQAVRGAYDSSPTVTPDDEAHKGKKE